MFLHIKRRRWLDKTSKEIVQRDWSLVSQGARMTVEFAAFLKALNISTKPNDCHAIGSFYGVNGKKLGRQYLDYLSEFKTWKDRPRAKQWHIFPENMGEYLSIDETALSKGGGICNYH